MTNTVEGIYTTLPYTTQGAYIILIQPGVFIQSCLLQKKGVCLFNSLFGTYCMPILLHMLILVVRNGLEFINVFINLPQDSYKAVFVRFVKHPGLARPIILC